MKRAVPLLTAAIIGMTCLMTACAGVNAAATASPAVTPNATPDTGMKLGLGIVTSIGSSSQASGDKVGNAQVDSLVATVVLDGTGKITKCSIDAAQTKIPFDTTGKITADMNAEIQTKNEKGENYGMKRASKIGMEWHEQAAAFADWTIGKTVDEVKNLKTKKVDDAHTEVPDVPELTSAVTITVGDFIKAIEKAVSNAK